MTFLISSLIPPACAIVRLCCRDHGAQKFLTFVMKSWYKFPLETQDVSRYKLDRRLMPMVYGTSTGCRAIASAHHGSASPNQHVDSN